MAFDFKAALQSGATEQDIRNYLKKNGRENEANAFFNRARQNQPKKKGFIREVAEGIVKPFARVGVAGANFGESIYDASRGDFRGANEALSKSRNIPGLGQTTPFSTGKESTGQMLKNISGTGLEIGSTIFGGGAAGGVAKNTFRGLVKQGFKQGVKLGFTSGAFTGLGQELQQKGSTTKDVLKSGLVGGLAGGLLGGATGALGGALGSTVRNTVNRLRTKVSREAFEIIRPELTLLEKQTALASGRATKGKLGKIEIMPTKRDLQVAQAVEGVVSKKKGLVGNIQAVRNEIEREANAVRAGLRRNNVEYDGSEFLGKLLELEKSPLLVSDTKLNNAYELAAEKFSEFASKEENNLAGLLTARQKFDAWIEKSFPRIFDDPNNSPLQEALRNMRTTANDFIESKLPAKSQFRTKLRRQNLMYEALDNIANKSRKDVGKNAVQRFMKKNPVVTNVAKVAGYGAAGAVGLGKVKEILK